MRPIKNRFFCLACGKPKMLFPTQKKAENIIKFNGDEILAETGIKLSRVYYCQLCGGYHVTSLESERLGRWLDRKIQSVVETYNLIQARKRRA